LKSCKEGDLKQLLANTTVACRLPDNYASFGNTTGRLTYWVRLSE